MSVLLFAATHGTLDVSDRTEVHARITQTNTSAGQPAQPLQGGLDLYNAPLASLHVSTVRWDYGLAYSPTISLQREGTLGQSAQDVQTDTDPVFFQYANASVTWHNRFLHIGVTEAASYGEFNSSLLLQAPALTSVSGGTTAPGVTPTQPPVQPGMTSGQAGGTTAQPSATQTVHIGSSITDGLVSARMDVYSDLSIGAGYSISGGVDASSRLVLPEIYGPHARASYARAMTRRDGLLTSVTGESTSSTGVSPVICQAGGIFASASGRCAPRVQLAQASEALVHRVTPALTLTVSAGVGAARWRTSPDHLDPWGSWLIYPVAGVAVADQVTRRWSFIASVALAPNVDPRTGFATELLQGSVIVTDRESRAVTLSAGLAAAGTLTLSKGTNLALSNDTAYDTYFVAGDFDAEFHVNRQVDIGVGERAAWQSASSLGGFFSMYTFAALTVRAPVTRF